MSLRLLLLIALTAALASCRGRKPSTPGDDGFEPAERGWRSYSPSVASAPEVEEAPPSRLEGSRIEPIGPLYDDGPKLEALTLRVLSARRVPKLDSPSRDLELNTNLAAALGHGPKPESLFTAQVEGNRVLVGSARLGRDGCYMLAGAERGLQGARLHLITGPPWPPTVVAQSSLFFKAGRVASGDGCLRTPDERGIDVLLVLESAGGTGEVLFGLFKVAETPP